MQEEFGLTVTEAGALKPFAKERLPCLFQDRGPGFSLIVDSLIIADSEAHVGKLFQRTLTRLFAGAIGGLAVSSLVAI